MSTTLSDSKKSLGLALGGGGARGLAHVGVLKVLVDQKIDISAISGCSMGGLIGTLFAIGYSVEAIKEIVLKHTSFREMINIVDRSPRRRGLIVGNRLRNLLSTLIGKKTTFKDTKIPLILNAVDLLSAREIALTEGNLVDAVMATIAVPGVFDPVYFDDMQLIDGGTLNNLPVNNLQVFSPERVIAVDVYPDIKNEIPWQISGEKPSLFIPIPNFLLDFYRAQMIMIARLTDVNLSENEPDLLIRPELPSKFTLFYGYQQAETIIEIGVKTTKKHLPKIREMLST